ncbi:MAG: hypothetical protein ABIT08_14415 [Bacteroidia bacterium]
MINRIKEGATKQHANHFFFEREPEINDGLENVEVVKLKVNGEVERQ